MAIVQGEVKIFRLFDDALVGIGRCAMHIADAARQGIQPVSGTVAVQWVDGPRPSAEDEEEYRFLFSDGRQIHAVFTKYLRTDNGPEVLRFRGRGTVS